MLSSLLDTVRLLSLLALASACACDTHDALPTEKLADPAATVTAIPSAVATPGPSAKPIAPPTPPLPPSPPAPSPSAAAHETPLASWMRTVVTPPFLAGDLEASAATFDRMATLRLPDLPNWTSISKDGAAAVRAGELDAAKAACRSCHEQYTALYRQKHASDPAPEP